MMSTYFIYDQNLRFYLPFFDPAKHFMRLVLTIAADTVALDIIFQGLLLMVISIMMKK